MGQRIVHVDDRRDYYLLVERAFRALAPTVGFKPFDNGRDAIEHLLGCAPGGFALPSLVLVDRTMPDMDGFEVVRAARAMAHLATVPIYILSETRTPEQVIEGTDAGADGTIKKPLGDHMQLARDILSLAPWQRQEILRESREIEAVPVRSVDTRFVHVNRELAGPYPGGHLNYAAQIAETPLAFALNLGIKDHITQRKRRNFVRVLFLLGWSIPECKLYIPGISDRYLEDQQGKPVLDSCGIRALALK